MVLYVHRNRTVIRNGKRSQKSYGLLGTGVRGGGRGGGLVGGGGAVIRAEIHLPVNTQLLASY